MRKRAFTLIELLVVVAIIGILATVVVVNLGNSQKKARDARRLSDVNQIAKAVDLYVLDYGEPAKTANPSSYSNAYGDAQNGSWDASYAGPADVNGGPFMRFLSGNWDTNANSNNTVYLSRVPVDPINTVLVEPDHICNETGQGYHYCYYYYGFFGGWTQDQIDGACGQANAKGCYKIIYYLEKDQAATRNDVRRIY